MSWKVVLSSRLWNIPTHRVHTVQSPVSSNEPTSALNMDLHQPSPTLIRSNARAKSPRSSQTHKSARTNVRQPKCKKEVNSGGVDSTISASSEAKTSTLSPPPYVLSLPEAVVTPPSLVAITNDELRSRGIYSPHPAMEHGKLHAPPSLYEPSVSRDTSFRSVLSMLAPRLGLRPIADLGGVMPRSEAHVRHQSSLVSSAFLVVGICISVLMISLDRGSITTAIPSILADFKSFQQMGWYGSAYLLTASAFQPMYGRIYSSFNIKWSFLGAIVIFEIGALVCALAPNSETFILGRAVQGLGSAGISTGSLAIVADTFSFERKPVLLAFLDAISWVGTVTGPVLGAVLSQLLSWKWCYYFNLMLAGISFACVLLFSKSHRSRTPRPNLIRQASDFSSTGKTFARRALALDWVGSLIFMAACTFLFLTLQLSQQREFDWSSPLWIVFISLSATTMVLCVLWMQLRGDNALVPFHILRQRTVAASCAAAFFLYGAFAVHIYYLPIWFQVIKNESAIESGAAIVPYMLVMAFLSLAASRYVFTNGHFALCTTVGCGIAVVGAGLMTLLNSEASMFTCAGFQVTIAAGLGIALQKSLSAVQAVLPAHEVSIGTSAVIAYQNAGGAIFVSIGNVLFQKYLFRGHNEPDLDLRVIMDLDMIDFATLIPDRSYSNVFKLYDHALQAVLIAVIPLCGIAFLLSMCMEWDIRTDQHARTPGSMNLQGFNRGLSSPELGSDAPTLAHLAPRARQRWSQRWSGPMTDIEVGRMRLTTVLQESNGSQSSLSSIEDAMDAEIKEMDIGRAH